MMASWSEHQSSSGRKYYYDRVSGRSVWERPVGFASADYKHVRPSLDHCLDESPQVASLFNAILKHCGHAAVPGIYTRAIAGDPLCEGGRGGAFCCKSNRIYICAHTWVGCREVAYELSHALNVCRGLVHCSSKGMQVDGRDCGYLGPPDVACSEYRASYWTGRCDGHGELESGSMRRCMQWHARWATQSCFPGDENLEAHVRWAQHSCHPRGSDVFLTRGTLSASKAVAHAVAADSSLSVDSTPRTADRFAEQAHRWSEG
jgi:hypothetical protein